MYLYHSVMAIVHIPPVSKKAILQPHTPGQASTKADTTMGPTIPATAPIVLAVRKLNKKKKRKKRRKERTGRISVVCTKHDTIGDTKQQ